MRRLRGVRAVSAGAAGLLVLALVLVAAPFAAPSPDPVRALRAPARVETGRGATISARVTRTSWVRVDLLRDGTLVRRLLRETHMAPGAVRARWDGRGADGRPVAAGIVEIRVVAYPGLRPFVLTHPIEVVR